MDAPGRRVERQILEEARSATVDVRCEHLQAVRRILTPTLASPQLLTSAFQEAVFHVPVFGEAPVARKRLVVTGGVAAPLPASMLPPVEAPVEALAEAPVEAPIESDAFAETEPAIVAETALAESPQDAESLFWAEAECDPEAVSEFEPWGEDDDTAPMQLDETAPIRVDEAASEQIDETEPIQVERELVEVAGVTVRRGAPPRWRQLLQEVHQGWSRARGT
jgi:hypothetical protein